MKKPLFITVLIVCCIFKLFAQDNRYIYSGEINLKKRNADDELYLKQTKIEEFNYNFFQNGLFTAKMLPVVFHIMYVDDQEIIPAEMIISQLEALNRDFGDPKIEERKIEPNHRQYAESALNPEIQFCLAKEDPGGKETDGIVYHRLFKNGWGPDDAIFNTFEGGIGPWDPERYINIWVSKMGQEVFGFAQSPGGKVSTDGIVIDYQFLGSNTELNLNSEFNQGKILTHLMGNYLGLISMWGETPCTDDNLWDTPIHEGPNFGYLGSGQVSSCPLYNFPLSMNENFMDTTPDSIRYMFTRQQVFRMHACLSEGGSRAGLLKTKIKCDIRKEDLEPTERAAKEKIAGVKIEIFPNPAIDLICVRVFSEDNSKLDLKVYNSIGQLIHKQNVIYDQVVINMNQWGTGTYFFKFTKDSKLVEIKTVTLTH
jgi:Pregnancy-associated plasma protein-A/Secretion system C-terminal sorting domain